MEARATTETIYGNSLSLDIPRVTCGDVDCTKVNMFTPKDKGVAVDIVTANESILHLINCFVDFFIQYQTDQTEEYFEPNLQTKELKEIIFLLCVESTCIEAFSKELRDCITPRSEFEIVQDVGNPVLRPTRIQTVNPTQKSTILFILVLSYKVLSFSGSLGIRIKDISDIIQSEKQREQAEKQREQEGKKSFILQFLSPGNEINCFQKAELFFMKNMNSTIFQKISSLSRGGSKRGNNKSRKNKYKRKYNHKYKKSKRYRRKTIKSK